MQAPHRQTTQKGWNRPALVIGSTDDNVLPFAAHAGSGGDLLGTAETARLAGGEGHFVYVDRYNLLINM